MAACSGPVPSFSARVVVPRPAQEQEASQGLKLHEKSSFPTEQSSAHAAERLVSIPWASLTESRLAWLTGSMYGSCKQASGVGGPLYIGAYNRPMQFPNGPRYFLAIQRLLCSQFGVVPNTKKTIVSWLDHSKNWQKMLAILPKSLKNARRPSQDKSTPWPADPVGQRTFTLPPSMIFPWDTYQGIPPSAPGSRWEDHPSNWKMIGGFPEIGVPLVIIHCHL